MDDLSGVDILILSSATSNMSHITPLSIDEQAALLEFVQTGGCVVLLPDNDNNFGGVGSSAANESLIDPFGMDIDGSLLGQQTAVVTDPSSSPVSVDGD